MSLESRLQACEVLHTLQYQKKLCKACISASGLCEDQTSSAASAPSPHGAPLKPCVAGTGEA